MFSEQGQKHFLIVFLAVVSRLTWNLYFLGMFFFSCLGDSSGGADFSEVWPVAVGKGDRERVALPVCVQRSLSSR